MPEPWAAAVLTGPLGDPRALADRAARLAAPFGSEVQLVRPEAVVGPRHVASAMEHAQRALREGRNRASGLGLEFLCYLSGQRQIAEALRRAGLPPGATRAVAAALGGRPREALEAVAKGAGLALAWDVPWQGEAALAALGAPAVAGPAELRALELVALLDTER